ncbi:hypothetical protein HCN44_007459 [Aphidius gifuensis]|uniref:NIF3-like protein 1 n=1 Tax=Aphidius gifuensis TaxID=684658 RepID=A0A835CN53_APHGI|nr:NIF3-like protein 1 [Aphidius gifuensis]KAF7989149.1 hypothetical protein HCN44_007459 [Aphidius gifuensis]
MFTSKIFNNLKTCNHFFKKNMSSNNGLSLERVVKSLNDYADLSLAGSWDNVGLLIQPTVQKNIKNILLTNDLTENVMKEAVDFDTDLIISYHPPIFSPLKRITNNSWKERIVAKCLENKIALYSPHTSFDSIKGGVNDWLANAFDIKTSEPIERSTSNPENGMGRICTINGSLTPEEAVELVKKRVNLKHVRLALAQPSGKMINTVAVCAGSGASVLKNIDADLFVTGEMLHHDILDAVHKGTTVILTNHSDSERGFLTEFSKILKTTLDNDSINIIVSKTDVDPLITV